MTLSILLYGAESWALVKSVESAESFVTFNHRFMLNIKRTDGIRKDRTLDTCNRRRNLADLLIQR